MESLKEGRHRGMGEEDENCMLGIRTDTFFGCLEIKDA
jgi:hypothetical protein